MSGYKIVNWGRFLATRDIGLRIRQDAAGKPCLDFTGVEAITIGFADELVADLVERGAVTAITGMNDEVRDSIDIALGRRGLSWPEDTHPSTDGGQG